MTAGQGVDDSVVSSRCRSPIARSSSIGDVIVGCSCEPFDVAARMLMYLGWLRLGMYVTTMDYPPAIAVRNGFDTFY